MKLAVLLDMQGCCSGPVPVAMRISEEDVQKGKD